MRPRGTAPERLSRAAVLAVLTIAAIQRPEIAQGCVGDCDADYAVAINEVVTAVNVSLETQPLSSCAAGDANDDGVIAINEITLAVRAALDGCAPDVHGATPVSVANHTARSTTVYVNFAYGSEVKQNHWESFCAGSLFSCQFELAGGATRELPIDGAQLDATFTFDSPVGCGATKADVNVNYFAWYDLLDVSLVDGYTNNIAIIVKPTSGAPIRLGPPNGQNDNESVLGVYPHGCDACVARCNPTCDISPSSPLVGCNGLCKNCESNGVDGCKAGTQSNPDVPCQFQGRQLGGGAETVQVVLMD